MVAGMPGTVRLSAFVVWVAIALPDDCIFVKEIEQRRGQLFGAFYYFRPSAQPLPVPRAEQGKKREPGSLKMSARREKAIEIRQSVAEAVAYAFDAIKRDGLDGREAGHGGCFHVHEGGGVIRFGEALLLHIAGDFGTGDEPAFRDPCSDAKALPGAGVDDAGTLWALPGATLSLSAPAQPVEMT